MAAATRLSKNPNPFRKDPKPRHLDGSAAWAKLKNQDPDKHYVFVNKGDLDAMSFYDSVGFDVEVLKENGVRPMGGRTGKIGDPIEVRGMILHSISKERQAEIEMHGADGDSGQADADRIEQDIIDRRGFDPLRGMHSRFIHLTKEIQAPEREVLNQ